MPITCQHEDRPALRSMWRGLHRRCPCCGEGKAFRSYLKLVDSCQVCASPLGQIRADDFPPYLTIFIVGHIVVPLVLLVGKTAAWSLTFQMIFWPLVTLVLSLIALPIIKGAVVGLMWALCLRGGDDQAGPVGEVRSQGAQGPAAAGHNAAASPRRTPEIRQSAAILSPARGARRSARRMASPGHPAHRVAQRWDSR